MPKKRKKGFDLGGKAKEAYRFREKLPTGGVAAPAHTYGVPKPQDGNVNALIESLETLTRATPALSKQYISAKQAAGQEAFLRGEEKPEHAVSVQIYERLNGLSYKGTMQIIALNKSNELFRDNPEIKYSQYEREMKKSITNPLKDKSADFLEGLSETLLGLQSGIPAQWQKHNTERKQVQGFSTLSQIGLDTTDETFTSDDVRVMQGLPPLTIKEKATKSRTGMNDLYNLSDVFDINDRAQLTQRFITVFGEKYSREGSPEKLAWMFMKDNHGIIPANTAAGAKANDYLASAIATKNRMLKNTEDAFKREKAEISLDIGRQFVVAANTLSPTDTLSWGKMRNIVTQSREYFSAPQLTTMYTLIDKMQDPGGFSRIGDDLPTFQTLMLQAQNGNLDPNKLLRNAHLLTKPTYMKIFSEHISAMGRAASDRKKSKPMSKVEKNLKSLQRSTVALSGATMDMVGNIIKKVDGDPRQVQFSQEVQMLWMYKTSNPNDFTDKDGKLDVKAVQATQQEIWMELSPDYPELTAKLITGNSNVVEADKLPLNNVEKQKQQLTNDIDKFIEEDAK